VSARVLWVVAALLGAGLTGIWLIPHDSTRDDVASYIERANEQGQQFTQQYRSVEAAYRTFATKPGHGPNTAKLRAAAERMTQLRAGLAAIPAPAKARLLRTKLIAFYRGQEQVAYELVGVAAYFPKLVDAERPLKGAAEAMRKDVGAAHTPTSQAAALGSYAGAIARTADRIEALKEPALFAKAKGLEIARLRKTERSVRAIRAALLANDRTALKTAVSKLAVSNNASAMATRAAVVAYNRHVDHIQKLGAAVELERRRLDRTL
jgi:hypothetical protein